MALVLWIILGIIALVVIIFFSYFNRFATLGNRIDKRIVQIESSGFKYSVKIDCTETVVEEIRSVLVSTLKSVNTLHLSSIRVEHRNSIFAEVKSLDRRQTDIETLVGQIRLLNEVRSVKWEEVKA